MNTKTLRLTGISTLALFSLTLVACGNADKTAGTEKVAHQEEAAPDNGATLAGVLAGEHRTDEERARDASRHPGETLEYFGIAPDMSVIEIWPGGGWYTQVIAPYLKSGGGKYYAAGFSKEGANERVLKALNAYEENYVSKPEIYGTVSMTVLGDNIAPDGPVDAILTFRNVHNWQSRDVAQDYFNEFFAALKSGGTLGVVEHRADGAELSRDGKTGYAYTDDVIALAEAAGFEFDGASEINANPKDTKDHPFGVWTLPPVKRSSAVRGTVDADFDRAPYDAIGESDRMTLKFRKP